jgi:hypothetical protein
MAGGHLGQRKTYAKVANKFYWPKLRDDVEAYCRSCSICMSSKPARPAEANASPITNTATPFELVGIDFIGPLTTTDNGNKYIGAHRLLDAMARSVRHKRHEGYHGR